MGICKETNVLSDISGALDAELLPCGSPSYRWHVARISCNISGSFTSLFPFYKLSLFNFGKFPQLSKQNLFTQFVML